MRIFGNLGLVLGLQFLLIEALFGGPRITRIKEGWAHLPTYKKCVIITGGLASLATVGVGVKEIFFDRPSSGVFVEQSESVKDTAHAVYIKSIFSILPLGFELRRHGDSESGRFQIVQGDRIFGGLRQVGSLRSIYQLEDVDGKLIAKATSELASVGLSLEMVDADGAVFARVSKEIKRSLLDKGSSYLISDAEGRKMGRIHLEQSDETGTKLRIYNPKDALAVEVVQNEWPSEPHWIVSTESGSVIDPRVVVLFSAFVTESKE